MISTGRAFKDNLKNKIYLFFYGVFASWSQWFITNCDMYNLPWTEEDVKRTKKFFRDIEELAEIDE